MLTFESFQKSDTSLNESVRVNKIKNNLLAIQTLFRHDYKTPNDITSLDWEELSPSQLDELARATKVVWKALDY